MSSKKTVIHEFDPCIYPRLLWVVKGGSLEEIRKTLELPELSEEDKRGGFLVWFPRASDIKHGDWIAHEASHVALGIFDYIGSTVAANDSEPFSYLVGWVFKCVDEVRKYKEVVNNGSSTGEQGDVEGVQSQEACEEKEEDRRR